MSEEKNVPIQENLNFNTNSESSVAGGDNQSYPSTQKKKKTVPIILGVIGALILVGAIVAAVLIFAGHDGGIVTAKQEPAVIWAKMTDDGAAYIPMFDGTCITINEEVKSAVLTKDKNRVVVMLEDGMLYVTDPQLSTKTTIADNAENFYIRDNGFLYRDEDQTLYRVLFADLTETTIGTELAMCVADDSLSILYATDDGHIYTMPETASDGTKVGNYNHSILVENISNDGQLAVWVKRNDYDQEIWLNDVDNREKLGDVSSKYDLTQTVFTKDQKMVVICNPYSDSMWIKIAGEDTVKVKLPNEIRAYDTFYTNNGPLNKENAENVQSIYISTEGDSGNNIYSVSISGERERVLSKVTDYAITNGEIIYRDENEDLFVGKLNDKEVSEEEKIASDVAQFQVTENGGYVYYTRDYEDGKASLYCYKLGGEDTVKIASEVASNGIKVSTDGDTIFYFKDMEDVPDTYAHYGTLMAWTYGNEEPVKITSDVLAYTVSSDIEGQHIKSDSFMFLKYNAADEDGNIYGDWMYFNGKDTVKVASDVRR